MCQHVLYADVVEPHEYRAFDAAFDMMHIDYAKHQQADGNPYSPTGQKLVDTIETFYMLQDDLKVAIAQGAAQQVIESIDEQWMLCFNRVRELGMELRLQYLACLPLWNATRH